MKLAVIALVTTLGLGGTSHADHASPGRRAEVRQRLLERFDRNQDGRLEPQERRRAIRVLRMLARRLAMQERADRHARGPMQRFDRNGDAVGDPGRLPRGRMFRRFDTNGDGAISPGELPRERMFRRFDANGDGMIAPGEAERGRAHRLRRLDRDGNGMVGPDELRRDRADQPRHFDRHGDGAIGPELPRGRTDELRQRDPDPAPDPDGAIERDELP